MPLFIDKNTILSQIPQEKIFEKYGAPFKNKLFRSPLRIDKKPTCSFYTKNEKLYMRDFSGHFWGDCFDYVQRLYGIKYGDALELIGIDFGLLDGIKKDKIIPPKKGIKSNVDIRVKRKKWSKHDLKYWNDYGITEKTLEKFKTYPAEIIWLNGEPIYNYHPAEPAYIYHFTGYNYQIYFPLSKRIRFLVSTGGLVHGFEQLPLKGDVCVITKSRKDIMCLDEFDIPAIAPVGESVLINKDMINIIKGRFKNVVSLMDYDNTGIHAAWQMRKLYNIKPLFLTEKLWNRKKGYKSAKDFADYCKMYKKVKSQNLIDYVRKSSNWSNS
jgi:hypothetical protein